MTAAPFDAVIHFAGKSASRAALSRMQLALHVTRRTRQTVHRAWCRQGRPDRWKSDVLGPGIVGVRESMSYDYSGYACHEYAPRSTPNSVASLIR